LKLDPAAALSALEDECSDILFEGTTEWVRTVAAILPNWSGMSRASLQPLADLVNVPIFAGSIGGRVPDRTAEGQALGSGTLDNGKTEKLVFFFSMESQVFHLAFNESHNANDVGFRLRNPGPYNSLRQAQESFFRTVNPRLRDVQFDIARSLSVIRIVVR
jgi:hypothetical protein